MAKYDEELERMLVLMEDKKAPTKKISSNIAYHANGADGKVYGIIKEGTKYYIKTTVSGQENICESYDYIGGFTNRREHEYSNYNEATKHLENELMYLNEQYGKSLPSSTVDMNRTEKSFAFLTEEARKEIDRMQQIYENSCKIGCFDDPESKGKSTGEQTEKNNEPFNKKANASLDKDPKFNGTVKSATDNKDVNSVDKDLQSDKMKTANSGSEKDYKDAHDDLDGNGVADKKPAGGKVVKVNEGLEEINYPEENSNIYDDGGAASMDFMDSDEFNPDDANMGNEFGTEEDVDDASVEDFETEEPVDDFAAAEEFNSEDDALVGTEGEEDDLDSLLEEFEASYGKADTSNANKSAITGPDAVMDKEKNPINHTNNGVDDETSEKWKRIDEEDGNVNEPTKQGNEETLKSYQKKGNLPVQSWDKMDEAIDRITESVYRKLTGKKKETLEEAISRMVKEEVARLNAWGKHPRYQDQPMTTPANKEVLAGTAEKDWNDDSAKGEQPYGQKIGKGDPFTEKVVNMLTDQVMSQLKENYKRK